jgi:uncharacterized membrane-anchored protein YitT (DUF2179 family)
MNSFSNIALILSSFSISLALFLFSLLAVFWTQRVIDFYLNSMNKSYFSDTYYGTFKKNQYEAIKQLSEKKWFHYNMKICGAVGISMALLILFATIHAIINFK